MSDFKAFKHSENLFEISGIAEYDSAPKVA